MKKFLGVLPVALALGAAPAPTRVGPPQCVLRAHVAAPIVRNDGRVYFRGQPNPHASYLAVFKGGECPGLNHFSAVAITSVRDAYCEGDTLRALNLPTSIPGPVCVIDHFEPFDGDIDKP